MRFACDLRSCEGLSDAPPIEIPWIYLSSDASVCPLSGNTGKPETLNRVHQFIVVGKGQTQTPTPTHPESPVYYSAGAAIDSQELRGLRLANRSYRASGMRRRSEPITKDESAISAYLAAICLPGPSLSTAYPVLMTMPGRGVSSGSPFDWRTLSYGVPSTCRECGGLNSLMKWRKCFLVPRVFIGVVARQCCLEPPQKRNSPVGR
eukprot:scaffold8563_cov248-Pinguiococcus_pyrenoidosus.AAC.1